MYTPKGTLNRDAQLRQYSPLVKRLAHHMIAKLPASVEVNDLIQVGMIGLTEALARFEPSQGVQFETFASQRIRGAMIDELRGGDWMSRGSRKSQKEIEEAVRLLEHKLHRPPMESEIAAELEMPLADYQELLAQSQGHPAGLPGRLCAAKTAAVTTLDRHVAKEDENPEHILGDVRMRAALVEAIKVLPEREQYIMSMYYEHDMNLKEIAAVLGVTESRICQLHSQSIARLRSRLRDH
jgi:RNA polymerase sigma factor for flagellar operon FliA